MTQRPRLPVFDVAVRIAVAVAPAALRSGVSHRTLSQQCVALAIELHQAMQCEVQKANGEPLGYAEIADDGTWWATIDVPDCIHTTTGPHLSLEEATLHLRAAYDRAKSAKGA